MPSILIVDDERNILSSLQGALGREDYAVDVAATLAEARDKLREAFDVLLLDVRLPDGSGIDLLSEVRQAAPETVVIMMSGHATIDTAVEATRLGAFDFFEKPVSLERLLVVLRNATRNRALETENRRLRASWAAAIVGRAPAIERVLGEIEKAGPADARVLIQGENGTGKELVARALHAASPRRSMPFVAVNCSAIPEELVESELFGHERGAFTGADSRRIGRFEQADGGTLFLDEIGDMSPALQTRLLRVLAESEFYRVGGQSSIRVDVRVIAATNQDLAKAVKEGRFREDLYHRLNVIRINTPPLRHRREDIPVLFNHYLADAAKELATPAKKISGDAMEILQSYDWPGNVRQLVNAARRLTVTAPGGVISSTDIQQDLGGKNDSSTAQNEWTRSLADWAEKRLSDAGAGPLLEEALPAFEKTLIRIALERARGHRQEAAKLLGWGRNTLTRKIRSLNLD
jgi:two-component system nitrogen regulation response regulator GlnG